MTSERTEKLAAVNYWDELLALRDRQREARKTAVQVVRKGGARPYIATVHDTSDANNLLSLPGSH